MNEIKVKISEDDKTVGYIKMPINSNVDKRIHKTIEIHELVDDYKGVTVYFDFNENNELLGIEISGDG
ncbi:MAG: hypothetical protein ACPG6V_05580 [Flavobacteriales bacterium]